MINAEIGDIEKSNVAAGYQNIVGSTVEGDLHFRDKFIYNIQQTSVAVNALHQLRAPVGDFVGRKQEIDDLFKALRGGSRACITGISGMGGIGKTELALLVAQRLSDDFPDAQFFLNLHGTDANPSAPQELMATCIRGFLGPEAKLPEDPDQLSQLYLSQLSGKRVLLLLDNAADGTQVRPLLPPTGCALLVTSRQAITLPGMTPFTLNPLTETEARELLLEIAPRAEAAADEICNLCGYLPLALRAAGSLLAVTPDLDATSYTVQLRDERNRLDRIGAEGVDIGVAASFSLSYERLTPESARVFRLSSVFPGTFDAAAAEVVCDDPGHVCLSDLVRRSLVLYENSTKRYRLHDLARLYAKTKLSTEERADGEKRHATYYKDVLSAADELYLRGGETLTRGLALFDLESANIQTGHAWVAAQDVENDEDVAKLGIAYPDVGVYVLNLRQHSREQIRWLEFALAAAKRLKDRASEGNALGNLGLVYTYLGETQHSIQLYEQALFILRELRDRKGEGAVLGNLGNAYKDIGEIPRAIPVFEQRLTIARELGDRRGEGSAVNNLGVSYARLGETKHAIQLYEQALLIFRELGDRRGEGAALGNLGIAYKNLDESQRAIQFHEEALLIDREIGDSRGEAADLWNMSVALVQVNKRAQAIQYAEQSLAILERIEDPNASPVREQLAAWREVTSQD